MVLRDGDVDGKVGVWLPRRELERRAQCRLGSCKEKLWR
jgi:hypothetical protein